MTSVFLDFVRVVVDRDVDQVSRRLAASPALATSSSGAEWFSASAQAGIIRLVLERGARVTDKDGRAKDVYQAAPSEWIRAVLRNARAG